MTAPLKGYRIVDMTQVVVGPYATSYLADYGADVIKIEPPTRDLSRNIAGKSPTPGMSSKYLHLNRNKRTIALDLKKPGGRGVLLRLVKTADALVYNVRPEAMARLQLTYDDVRAAKPNIIYCGIYGFGQDGPYAAKPAYDSIIQGSSGLASLLERSSGTPRYVGMVIADRIVGLMALNALLTALLHRERTGAGQRIDVPMFENMAAFVLNDHAFTRAFDPPLGPPGDTRLLDPDARPLKTRDGYICITANTDQQAAGLFDAFGMSELKDDPRFKSVAQRAANTRAYFGIREKALASKTTAEWLAIFERHDIPAMPYHTLESIWDDPHLKAVGFFERVEHPTQGAYWHMPPPTKLSAYRAGIERHAPHYGEQSVEILREAGYSAKEIESLIAAGVVTDGSDEAARLRAERASKKSRE
jgi:crotonobetainyl-CoA:carnitine CoA-transferase CaiB-like acyl-CoA transferase